MTNADSRAAGGRFRALYVMAHPDDEDAATLVWLARVVGVDVTVYSLTRGELGDNAIGTEMAEALGALRMGEMDAAARAYGVARVWFGGCFDYGYSKRLEEAWVRWGRSRVVGELALALRAASRTASGSSRKPSAESVGISMGVAPIIFTPRSCAW